MIAFAALVLDIAHAFQLRRHLQVSADAAALAAAQELPCLPPEAMCVSTSVAHNYSGEPSGRNERSSLPAVTTTVEYPTSLKVKVTQSATSGFFFGRVLGLGGFPVSASAIASKQSNPVGTPLAVYVHELCGHKGFISGGLNMRIEGGIHSNGEFEVKNQGFEAAGGATIYRPPHPGPGQNTCKSPPLDQPDSTYFGAVGDPTHHRWRDWATPYHTAGDVLSGGPCTINHDNDVKYENTAIPDGVHCLPNDKKFTIAGSVTGKITVVGGIIEVGGTGTLDPYNDAVPVLFYSTNTSGVEIKLNPSMAYDWTGYIINRQGGIVINAAAVTSPFEGLLEAEWIEINGENFTMLGTFPDTPPGSLVGVVRLEE
jgi:hypothetical protein